MLGFGRLSKIGWIFTQSTKERDFIMSSEEICQIAGMSCSEQQVLASGVHSLIWSRKAQHLLSGRAVKQARLQAVL